MRKTTLFLFVILLVYIAYILVTTGYYRTINPMFDGEIIQKIPIKGAEDIMISLKDSFALISATDRSNTAGKSKRDGGLYLIDLTKENYSPIDLTESLNMDFEPHGISYFKKDSVYHILAINHAKEKEAIELFELNGLTLTHKKTLMDESMIQPNDLVMLDENRFYYTNDHRYTKGIGKFLEEYLGLAVSNVVYFDGDNYKEVADGIAYANGINYDADRNLLFVASPRGFGVKVYKRSDDGSLAFIEDIPCGTGVDNIEFDSNKNLWIGAHPNLLAFSAYSNGKKSKAPSEIIEIDYFGHGEYSVEKIYIGDGSNMSGSTVAATFENLIFVGNVMNDEFMILKRN